MDPEREPCEDPAWLYLLVGWLLASTQLAHVRLALSPSEVRSRAPAEVLEPPEQDLDHMSLRELRRLPGIGPTRALEIARARWDRGLTGGPDAWEELPGIGPETVRAVREMPERRTRVVSHLPPP